MEATELLYLVWDNSELETANQMACFLNGLQHCSRGMQAEKAKI